LPAFGFFRPCTPEGKPWQNAKQEILSAATKWKAAVYGADQEKIGSIKRVMIDKVSGKVAYAVLSYGGFLGIGGGHFRDAVVEPDL
jgi:hypothetical protein